MPIQVLHRDSWDGRPKKQADWIRMTKERDGRAHSVVAELWTHLFGWELRMLIDGELQQSQVCRTQDEVLDTVDAWRKR